MGDIRREMERLRPVYETGVLRLLLRQNSMMYVALLRAAFDPLTGELPRETLEESFSQSLSRLVDSGEYQLREDQTIADASRRILADLTREGDDDYAWLANSHDAASHRFLYRLTARAHRAIEALSRLEDDSRTLSGAQANSIIMEIEHARMQLTADPGERVALLNREIKARKHEIRQIRHGQRQAALTESQVEDVIAVIHNTLRGVPIDLRELVLTERDNGDALRRRMQAGDMSVDDILTSYHDEYRRSFSESDSGRRFEDAFQVIITDEGRQQIDAALRDIAHTPYLAGESGVLLDQVRAELSRIYDGIEAVRRQMRVSDEAISRLVRQQTDTRYRTMLGKLNRLYAHVNADAKAHQGDDETVPDRYRGRQVPSAAVAPRAPDGANDHPGIVRPADTGRCARARPAFDDRQRGTAAAAHGRAHPRIARLRGRRERCHRHRRQLQRTAESRAEGKRARRFPGRARLRGRSRRRMALHIGRRKPEGLDHRPSARTRG